MSKRKRKRDIEKDYPAKQFAQKLRRLAECIEKGQLFNFGNPYLEETV